ncbi:MAG: hypothetical protein QXW77_03940 [Candidatus Hadarchaeales archaeon]
MKKQVLPAAEHPKAEVRVEKVSTLLERGAERTQVTWGAAGISRLQYSVPGPTLILEL